MGVLVVATVVAVTTSVAVLQLWFGEQSAVAPTDGKFAQTLILAANVVAAAGIGTVAMNASRG